MKHFTLESLEGRQYRYSVSGRWEATATNNTGTGPVGHPATITFSFERDGTTSASTQGEPNVGSTLISKLNALYGSQAVWLPLFRQAFSVWSFAAGPMFQYEPNDDGASGLFQTGHLGVRGDVRISAHPIDGPNGTLAQTYYPNGGELILDSDDLTGNGWLTNLSNNSLRLRNTVTHEAGHALGFDHSTVAGAIMNAFVHTDFDPAVTGLPSDDKAAATFDYGNAPIPGDANLDGKIDISDYGRIDFNVGLGVEGWYNGDFNYDGKIDISDYGRIDFWNHIKNG